MKRWLFLFLLVAAWAAEPRQFEGYIHANERGWAAVRNQMDYEAFVARVPVKRIQKKQPAPPSEDPLLRTPAIDFSQRSLVAVWSENIHIDAKISDARREGDNMLVTVTFEVPPNYRNYATPYGYGQYHLLEVEKFSGELKVNQP